VEEPRGCWEQLDASTQRKILEHIKRKIQRKLDKSSKNVKSKDLKKPKLNYALIQQQWDAVPSSPPHSPPHKRRRLEDKEASHPTSSESDDETHGDKEASRSPELEDEDQGDKEASQSPEPGDKAREYEGASSPPPAELEDGSQGDGDEISPLDGEGNHSSEFGSADEDESDDGGDSAAEDSDGAADD
jgi:hypothetical protein